MAMFGQPYGQLDPYAALMASAGQQSPFAQSQGLPQAPTGVPSPFGVPGPQQAPQQPPVPPLMAGAPAAPPPAPGLGMGMAPTPTPPKKPGINIGDLLSTFALNVGASYGNPLAMQTLQQQAALRAQRQKMQAERYAPQHVGDAIIHLDPTTGKYLTDYAPQPAAHVGPTQQKITDLIANGATPEQIKAFIAAEANPLTWLRGENGDGTVTMTPVPKGAPAGAPTSGPAPGTVDGNYRFKGGDFKNPANWELVGGAGSQAPRTFPGLPRGAR